MNVRRFGIAFALALVVAMLAARCSGGSKPAREGTANTVATPATPAPPPDPQGPFRAVPGTAVAQLTLDQLGELQKSTTLGEWKAAHANDVVSPHHAQHAEPTTNDWCARAIAETTVDNDKTMRRTAYFYPPPVPDPPAVPDETPEQLVDRCRLGLVWIETADADAKTAMSTAADANQGISANLGAGAVSKVAWWDAASWKNTARWSSSDVVIVMGTTANPPWKSERQARPMRVIVAAAGPASGITFQPASATGIAASSRMDQELTAQRLDEAIRLAGREESLERPIREFAAIFEGRDGETRMLTAAERTAFVGAVEAWVEAKPESPLPAQRRVAALVAADLIMQESYATAGWSEKRATALRKPLAAKGATFADSPVGQVVVYTHSWLKNADRMNAGGRASELAFLALMSLGFETSGMCLDHGTNGFEEVIRRGEEFLRTHPNSPALGDVHLLIAYAYADIVALADGIAPERADADEFKDDAERGRTRALGEFHSALTSNPSSPQLRVLWPTIWRLAAGLAPTQTKFFCVSD